VLPDLSGIFSVNTFCEYVPCASPGARRRTWLNVERHDIDFSDAIRISRDQPLELEDRRYDYGEVRVIAMGLVFNGVVVVV
jgi:uncharacterized DUF497 family protein